MTEAKRSGTEWLETVSIGIALVFVFWFVIDQLLATAKSSVIYFGPPSSIEITNAAPGEWSTASIPIKKRRDCPLSADSRVLVSYPASEALEAAQWTRDTPQFDVSKEWQGAEIAFKVPYDAPPGEAVVIFEPVFGCTALSVRQRSPAARFTILEPLPESNE